MAILVPFLAGAIVVDLMLNRKQAKPESTPVQTNIITITPTPEILTAKAVMEFIIKRFNKTQNSEQLHEDYNCWLQEVMEKFNEYEVAYLGVLFVRSTEAGVLQVSKVPCFNAFHKNYGAYVIAYKYQLAEA